MHSLKTNPKVQFIFFLLLFFIVISFRIPLVQSFSILTICVSFSALADIVFTYVRKKTLFIPYSAVITGLILSLVADPYAPWFQILVICVAAIGTKHFLRITGRHMFNPAAIGLLTGWIIYGIHPSWWGPSLYTPGTFTVPNTIIFLSFLPLAFVSCYKYKRFYIVISFLFLFVILRLLIFPSTSLPSVFSLIISPGMVFYAVVMLVEPRTSPVGKSRQVLYGLFVALVLTVLVYVVGNSNPEINSYFPDLSIVSLLVGNLLFSDFCYNILFLRGRV